MNDERLDYLLHLLKQTEVQPPLVSDSRIRLMITNHRIVWIGLPFLASLVIATGIGYLVEPAGNTKGSNRSETTAAQSSLSQSVPSRTPIDSDLDVGTQISVDTAKQTESVLDPRSILTLSLTDEELLPFGIIRGADTVTVHIQALVAEDTLRARKLNLTLEQLRDTNLLFYRAYGYHGPAPGRILAKGPTSNLLDERSPIFVLPTLDKQRPAFMAIVGTAPALLSYELFSSVTSASVMIQPSPMERPVTEMSYLASLPDDDSRILPPSRKPILLQVRDKSNSFRYLVAVMPTRAVLNQLPKRFSDALLTCYEPFVPHVPSPSTVLKNKHQVEASIQKTNTRLIKVAGIAGHPFIELSGNALMPFGVITDDVSICEGGWSVATVDTVTTTFVKASSKRPLNAYLTSLSYRSATPMQRIDGAESPVGKLGRLNPDAGSSLEIHVSGQIDTAILCYTSHAIGSMAIDSVPPADWLDRYPLARRFAAEVAWDIMSQQIPTDSLGYYSARIGNQVIPVLKLLFGLRVSTPWVSRPDWNGDKRRLVRISWYLPTQPVMSALPESIRQFIQPEYEALYASIEQAQSLSQACTLLNHPSALGFCSIGDTTLRIDGVGPIPAKDELTLYVTSADDVTAALQLIDNNGNVVQDKTRISITKGANQIPLPIESTLPSGSYMVILSTASQTRRSRVLISR